MVEVAGLLSPSCRTGPGNPAGHPTQSPG